MQKLRTRPWLGRFFAASRERLREAAARLNVRRVGNLAGCPALRCELHCGSHRECGQPSPLLAAGKPSAPTVDHFSLETTRTAWSDPGIPSGPVGFASAAPPRVSVGVFHRRCAQRDQRAPGPVARRARDELHWRGRSGRKMRRGCLSFCLKCAEDACPFALPCAHWAPGRR